MIELHLRYLPDIDVMFSDDSGWKSMARDVELYADVVCIYCISGKDNINRSNALCNENKRTHTQYNLKNKMKDTDHISVICIYQILI